MLEKEEIVSAAIKSFLDIISCAGNHRKPTDDLSECREGKEREKRVG
jgi:hypothetical protein